MSFKRLSVGRLQWVLYLTLGIASCASYSEVPQMETIMMYKSVGAKQCDAPSMTSSSRASVESSLKNAGVEVQGVECGNDGMMRATVCGADSGDVWIISISQAQTRLAEEMGYVLVSDSSPVSVVNCR